MECRRPYAAPEYSAASPLETGPGSVSAAERYHEIRPAQKILNTVDLVLTPLECTVVSLRRVQLNRLGS